MPKHTRWPASFNASTVFLQNAIAVATGGMIMAGDGAGSVGIANVGNMYEGRTVLLGFFLRWGWQC